MALSFRGVEPVAFGVGTDRIEEVPKVTQELKLRMQEAAKNASANFAGVMDVMAEAFPQNKDKIRQFMEEKMTEADLSVLLSYLIGGETGTDLMKEKAMKGMSND